MDRISLRVSKEKNGPPELEAKKSQVCVFELIRYRRFPRQFSGSPATFGQVCGLADTVATLSAAVEKLSEKVENDDSGEPVPESKVEIRLDEIGGAQGPFRASGRAQGDSVPAGKLGSRLGFLALPEPVARRCLGPKQPAADAGSFRRSQPVLRGTAPLSLLRAPSNRPCFSRGVPLPPPLILPFRFCFGSLLQA